MLQQILLKMLTALHHELDKKHMFCQNKPKYVQAGGKKTDVDI